MTPKMTPQDIQVFQARKELVIKYRISSNPWPDGIDSKWDRWYIESEWDDDGTYHGVLPMPKRPEIVDNSTVDTKIVDTSSVDKGGDRTEYFREQKRKQRAAKKLLEEGK